MPQPFPPQDPDAFNDARITVMGLGNFGGGAGVTRWLCDQGATVLLTDTEPPEKLKAAIASIQDLIDSNQVTLRLGEHNISDFTTPDLVVANPAVPKPWENRFLRATHAAGIPITTEIRLLVERLPPDAPTLGITGSAGKSTTSAMIAHALRSISPSPTVHFGGNIGGSLLPALASMSPTDFIILELSSAMLYWLGKDVGYSGAGAWSPRVAILTNLQENHTDWHGSFEHYADSKFNIFANQSPPAIAIVGQSSAEIEHRFGRLNRKPHQLGSSESERTLSDLGDMNELANLQIPGAHNVLNARLALLALALGVRVFPRLLEGPQSFLQAARALQTFPGLPHRLQFAAERGGIRYFNDSKSTTPASCLLAVAAFDDKPGRNKVHLIVGGYDKKSDLTPVAQLAPQLAGLYTIGTTGPIIASLSRGENIHQCVTLSAAMERMRERARAGDIVLLSPACASWDQFTNYEARGDQFCELAKAP